MAKHNSALRSGLTALADFGKGRLIGIAVCLVILIMGLLSLRVNREDVGNAVEDMLVDSHEHVFDENEGRLVLVTGTPKLKKDVLNDEETGLKAPGAAIYTRDVFQLIYEKYSEEVLIDENDPSDSYDDEYETVYYIVKNWVAPSSSRDATLRHSGKVYENPSPIKDESSFIFNTFVIGDFEFELADFQNNFHTSEHYYSEKDLSKDPLDWANSAYGGFQVCTNDNGHECLKTTVDGESQVGDLMVTFSYTTVDDLGPITIVGKQQGNTLVPYEYETLDLYSAQLGSLTTEDYVTRYKAEDAGDRKAALIFMVIIPLVIMAVCIVTGVMENRKYNKPDTSSEPKAKRQPSNPAQPDLSQYVQQPRGIAAAPQQTQFAHNQYAQQPRPTSSQYAQQTQRTPSQYAQQSRGIAATPQQTQFAPNQYAQPTQPAPSQYAQQSRGIAATPQQTQFAPNQYAQQPRPTSSQYAQQPQVSPYQYVQQPQPASNQVPPAESSPSQVQK